MYKIINLIMTEINTTQSTKKVFRFNLSKNVIEKLTIFSKIHQYDDRKEYKEAWDKWYADRENKAFIDDEKTRLEMLGYEGDLEKKMYKAGRYYFKKKTNEKIEPKKRGQYISISEEIRQKMDEHIRQTDLSVKPSDSLQEFNKKNDVLINEEIDRLKLLQTIKRDEIEIKIKKLYKNRCNIYKIRQEKAT